MSPLMFILFLKYLTSELNIDTNTGNIKDDIIDLFQKCFAFCRRYSSYIGSVHDLQELLNKLSSYLRNGILRPTDKPKAMLFKPSNRPGSFAIFYDNVRLENVNSFIYLGVCLSSNGSFYIAQKHLSEQASKALYSSISLFDKCYMCIDDKLNGSFKRVRAFISLGSLW